MMDFGGAVKCVEIKKEHQLLKHYAQQTLTLRD